MKKLFAFTLVSMGLLILSACASKNATASKSSLIYGTWTMNTVTIDGPSLNVDKMDISVFGNTPRPCLLGSQWNLPSNGNGSYTLNTTSNGCNGSTQTIVWSRFNSNGVDYFQFKKRADGIKDKNITDGFQLELISLSSNSMTWRSPINVAGRSTYINYTLNK